MRKLEVFLDGSPGGEENLLSAAKVDVAILSKRVLLLSSSDNVNIDDPSSIKILAETRLKEYSTTQMKAFSSKENYPPL